MAPASVFNSFAWPINACCALGKSEYALSHLPIAIDSNWAKCMLQLCVCALQIFPMVMALSLLLLLGVEGRGGWQGNSFCRPCA